MHFSQQCMLSTYYMQGIKLSAVESSKPSKFSTITEPDT